MTNFEFLKKDEKFSSFADIAITAEKLYGIDTASCVFNVRRAALSRGLHPASDPSC